MMRSRAYHIDVEDSILDPYQGTSKEGKDLNTHAYYKEKGEGKRLYKVWVYLKGNDLPFVRRVVYKLHPTFMKPLRVVEKTYENPGCALVLWTWGLFSVEAKVEFKDGSVVSLDHYLTYNNDFDRTDISWLKQ
jgi:transcription initiation factor IIF auxiliary subunit